YREAIDRPGAPDRLRRNLIGGLIPFGPAARGAVPAIVGAFRSAGWDPAIVRAPGANPARGIAGPRSPAMERVDLRLEAARALGVLAPGTPSAGDAVAALAEAVDDPDEGVNQEVTESLLAFGAAARPSAPALLRAVDRARAQKKLFRAGRMAEAVGRIDP